MKTAGDRTRIARAFHRHAGEYDRYASVQKRVALQLDRQIAAQLDVHPAMILDIGCGTGAMLAALGSRYPQASLFGLDLAFNMALRSSHRLSGKAHIVNAAAEQLPFRDYSFDLIVTASTLQWVGRLDLCFNDCLRVLKRGGLFCAAFYGGRTLWELRDCYRQAVSRRFGTDDPRNERTQRFKTVEEVREHLTGSGYGQVQVVSEMEIEYHDDVPQLLRAIKGIGAATAARGDGAGGLGWRAVLAEMADIYRERFLAEGKIPASYEVLYVIARRPA